MTSVSTNEEVLVGSESGSGSYATNSVVYVGRTSFRIEEVSTPTPTARIGVVASMAEGDWSESVGSVEADPEPAGWAEHDGGLATAVSGRTVRLPVWAIGALAVVAFASGVLISAGGLRLLRGDTPAQQMVQAVAPSTAPVAPIIEPINK